MKNLNSLKQIKRRTLLTLVIMVTVIPVALFGLLLIPAVRTALSDAVFSTGVIESWSNKNIARTKERGNAIAQSLEKYHKDHGNL